MGKKKEFTSVEIEDMINMYNNEYCGTPIISKKYCVDKSVINRVLKANGVVLGKSGRKFKGGKSEADKRFYQTHKDGLLKYHKEWRCDNKDKLKEYHKEWRTNNRESLRKKQREYELKRVSSDPQYKLHKRISSALYSNLKEFNIKKVCSTFDILDFDLLELKTHLELLFTEGMSWDNYGEWHIDHIKPMKSFNFTVVNDFEFKKCWSLNNLQPLWSTNRFIDGVFYEGNLNKGNVIPKTCYQHRVNQINKIKEEGDILFDYTTLSLKNSTVKLIDKKTAKEIIDKHEWLGFMPNYTKYHFGLYFEVNGVEYLGGVVTFQDEYGQSTNTWDRYGYTDKIILLSRGVSVWWSPKNTASHLISKAIKYLTKNTKYRIITATIDNLAGEVGTIYQASNWDYVGVMDGNILPNGKERTRLGVIIDEKLYTSRQIRNMLGTMKKSVILETYPQAIFIKQKAKDRYFYFTGNKKEININRGKLLSMMKTYPKRIT